MAPDCFVCGAAGANRELRCRPHGDKPFFPFLEQHDASKLHKIRSDGTVDSCSVCYAFLVQQWMAYDKSKTPVSKRLYWRKTIDLNGRRQSGDYGDTGRYDDEEELDYPAGAYNSPSINEGSYNSTIVAPRSDAVTHYGPNVTGMDFDVKIPAISICYGCGVSSPSYSTHIVHTSHWSKSEAPYFPCLLTHTAPIGAKPVDQLGRVLMCDGCTGYLIRQWQNFELDGVPIHERRYHLKSDHSTKTIPGHSGRSISMSKPCFICSQIQPFSDLKRIYSKRISPTEPFFPFLDTLNASETNCDGIYLVCNDCFESLDEQWTAHDFAKTPFEKRVYQTSSNSMSHSEQALDLSNPGKRTCHTDVVTGPDVKSEVCYLCGILTTIVEISLISTVPKMNSLGGGDQSFMFFPFLKELRKPPLAKPINENGEVFVCRGCSTQLEMQWKVFDAEETAHRDRRYMVGPMYKECPPMASSHRKKMQTDHSSDGLICFLCGSENSHQIMKKLNAFPNQQSNTSPSISTTDNVQPFFPMLMVVGRAPGAEPISKEGEVQVCPLCEANLLSQWNIYQTSSTEGMKDPRLRRYLIHFFICTTCKRECHIKKAEAVSQKDFPFLRKMFKEGGGIRLEESDQFVICSPCKSSFEKLVREVEEGGDDHQRGSEDWRGREAHNKERTGDTKKTVDSTSSSPGPNGRKNDSVIVIDSDSDGEREGGTPYHLSKHHLAKYQTAAVHPELSHRSPPIGSSVTVLPLPRLPPEVRPGSQGAHHPLSGTKPPPLTIVTSANGRATRTTATVTPFSQSAVSSITVTSGNSANALAATRTSSFAAALRKLAKQANENDEVSPQVSPGSASRSPVTTPSNKNYHHLGPSPLMAPTSTPPVVTITPTHSATARSTSVEARRDLERYQLWRKDSPTLPPRRPMAQHIPKPEEGPNRGFQPYRPGDEFRLSAAELRPPHHLTYDPAAMAAMASSYPFPPTFIPPSPLQYPAFRNDENALSNWMAIALNSHQRPEEQFERYGYLRHPLFPLAPPHLIPHPALLPGLRYPSELALHIPHLPSQGVSYGGLVSSASTAERERVLQELRERERKVEEAREVEMHLHRERSNSLAEREERHKHTSDGHRSPHRESSHHHINRLHSHQHHSSRSGTSSSYDQIPIPLVKKPDEDRWPHKARHTSPVKHEEHHHRSTPSHKEKQYHHNSVQESSSSRNDVERPDVPRLFHPDKRHEQESNTSSRHPSKEHSTVRPPPPLVSANHVTHDHSIHNRVTESGSGSETNSHKSTDEVARKAKIRGHIPSSLNLHSSSPSPASLPLSASTPPEKHQLNHTATKVPHLKNLELDKPKQEFEFHLQEFYRNQLLRPEKVPSRNSYHLPNNLEKENVQPVRSKLDLEEEKRKEWRANGIYMTSESESDSDEDLETKRDRYRQNMMKVTTKSNLPLDKSEGKVTFLGAVGLVTQNTKEEISEERRKKRRRLLKEDNPYGRNKALKLEVPSLLPAPAKISSKQFRKEPEYSKKCEFLHSFSLKLTSSEKRKELEAMKAILHAYKARKACKELVACLTPEISTINSDKSEESLPPGMPLAVQCGTPTVSVHVPSQLTDSSTSEPSSESNKAPFAFNNHLLQTVPTLQNGMVHSNATQPVTELKQIKQEKFDEPCDTNSRFSEKDKKKHSSPAGFSIASFLDLSNDKKRVDAQSFAQEFHNSVLRTTQEALANQKTSTPSESSRRESLFPSYKQSSSHSINTHIRHRPYPHAALKPSLQSNSSSSSSSSPSPTPFQWPGIDQVAEAYCRYIIDHNLEHNVLNDQLRRLQTNNIELRGKDEQLRLKMAELMEKRQAEYQSHDRIQKELEQLKRYVDEISKRTEIP